jgi:hypothetical protein
MQIIWRRHDAAGWIAAVLADTGLILAWQGNGVDLKSATTHEADLK